MSRLIEKLMNCKSSSSLKRQVTFSPCTDRVCVCVCVCVCVSRSVAFNSLRPCIEKIDQE